MTAIRDPQYIFESNVDSLEQDEKVQSNLKKTYVAYNNTLRRENNKKESSKSH